MIELLIKKIKTFTQESIPKSSLPNPLLGYHNHILHYNLQIVTSNLTQ